jgi:hypothetical protein
MIRRMKFTDKRFQFNHSPVAMNSLITQSASVYLDLLPHFKRMLYKVRKYLTIIEHVFHSITHFSCQILSFIHAFVLHMNRLKVDVDYIPELGFFSRDFGANIITSI